VGVLLLAKNWHPIPKPPHNPQKRFPKEKETNKEDSFLHK
jgi:hypothetical protein